MKKKIINFIAVIIILGLPLQSIAQFTTAEVAEREQWEDFLNTAIIIDHEQLFDGITKPFKLHLRKGEIERYGVWKNCKGFQHGAFEGWQYEIAAYRMDKLLSLNMVPPTIERRFKKERGSLQLWIEHKYSLLKILRQKIPVPPSEYENFNKAKYLKRVFDSLIANEDRTQENTLFTADWRLILIDHSRSFRSSKDFTKKLLYSKNNKKHPSPFRQLPRAFVEKLKALDFDNIKKTVGSYLTDKEIRAVIIRKNLILEEIEEMIAEKGEDKVLY
jgi:hypothetical protein